MSIINILLTIYAPSSCLAYENSAAICVAIVLFIRYVIGIFVLWSNQIVCIKMNRDELEPSEIRDIFTLRVSLIK